MIELSFFSETNEKEWNDAVKKLDGNYFFTHEYLQYFNYLNIDNLINKSFILKEKNKILSITPLLIFENGLIKEASFAGNPLLFSLIAKVQNNQRYNQILNKIYEKKIELSKKYNVKKILIRLPYMSNNDNYVFFKEIINKFNFTIIKSSDFFSLRSTAELILNLEHDIALRKKNTSYVKYTNEKTTFKVLSKDSFDENLFNIYCKFHNENKKNKRSAENFVYNRSLILKGMQCVFLCILNDKIINALVTVNFNNKAYYNSSVNKIVDKKIYGNFVLINKALNFYKNRNFREFSMGDVVDDKSLQNCEYSDKEKNLSRFKNNWKGNLLYFNNYFHDF
jgi:hypothetical protein